jgi:hypothetical protein
VDFAGPFMGDNFFILVDAHSKWPEVYRMKSTTANDTIEVLRHIFSQHGIPTELVSDNGPQFKSTEFELFLKANYVKHISSAPYHPSSNGEAERFVQTFKRAMKVKRVQHKTWSQKLCEFLLSYRTTPHSTTRKTPAEMMGRNLRTRLSAVKPSLGERIQRQGSDPGHSSRGRYIEVGEPVLAKDYRMRKETWIPGVIVRVLGPCTYMVQVGDLLWKRHIDQLRATNGDIMDKYNSVSEVVPQDIDILPPVVRESNNVEEQVCDPNVPSGTDVSGMAAGLQGSNHGNRDIPEVAHSANLEVRRSGNRDIPELAHWPNLEVRRSGNRDIPKVASSTYPEVRRSSRRKGEPAYLKDYVK